MNYSVDLTGLPKSGVLNFSCERLSLKADESSGTEVNFESVRLDRDPVFPSTLNKPLLSAEKI